MHEVHRSIAQQKRGRRTFPSNFNGRTMIAVASVRTPSTLNVNMRMLIGTNQNFVLEQQRLLCLMHSSMAASRNIEYSIKWRYNYALVIDCLWWSRVKRKPKRHDTDGIYNLNAKPIFKYYSSDVRLWRNGIDSILNISYFVFFPFWRTIIWLRRCHRSMLFSELVSHV